MEPRKIQLKTRTLDELVDALAGLGRIQTTVESLWGTQELDAYLLNLITDTRSDTRDGFAPTVFLALVELQSMNLSILVEKGLVGEDTSQDLNSRLSTSFFDDTSWTLPKNF